MLGVSRRASLERDIRRNYKMEKKVTIAEMKAVSEKPEKFEQSKFMDWWEDKAEPWLGECFKNLNAALCSIRMPRLSTILILAILVYMTNNGALDEMPNAKWMVECCVRVMELVFGAFRWIVEQVIHLLDSEFVNTIDILGLNEILSNIMKAIFGM